MTAELILNIVIFFEVFAIMLISCLQVAEFKHDMRGRLIRLEDEIYKMENELYTVKHMMKELEKT